MEYWEKTIDLSQVIDKLYHIMLYLVLLAMSKFQTLVVIGIDCNPTTGVPYDRDQDGLNVGTVMSHTEK